MKESSLPGERFDPPIAVVGLGLVGGSIARAFRAQHPTGEILGVDPHGGTRDHALRAGVITRAGAAITDIEGWERCQAIFVAVPLAAIPKVFQQLAQQLTDAQSPPLTTDVSGVRAPVHAWAKEYLGTLPFVGSHPMAGGEGGGFGKARPDLFRHRPVALCPGAHATEQQQQRLEAYWRATGAKPMVMEPEFHDRAVAHTSHLPYLSALAQVQLVGSDPEQWRLMGRGFEDATRHAAFAPEVMASVTAHNPFIPAAARALADALVQLADLAEHRPEELIAKAEELRRRRDKMGW